MNTTGRSPLRNIHWSIAHSVFSTEDHWDPLMSNLCQALIIAYSESPWSFLPEHSAPSILGCRMRGTITLGCLGCLRSNTTSQSRRGSREASQLKRGYGNPKLKNATDTTYKYYTILPFLNSCSLLRFLFPPQESCLRRKRCLSQARGIKRVPHLATKKM